MTMERLYEHMKEALKFFDLSFHQMDQVEVRVVRGHLGDQSVTFFHAGRSCSMTVPSD
jgi:hypothetical protein